MRSFVIIWVLTKLKIRSIIKVGLRCTILSDGWHRVATRYIEFKKSNYSKFDGASVDFYE